MRFRRSDWRHEGARNLDAHVEVRPRYFQLNFETSPNCWVEEAGVVGDTNGQTDFASRVEVLQQRIHYTFDLTDLLRIVPEFGDCIKFV